MGRTAHVVAGEPELHCWCPVCLLPIRLRIPLHLDDTRSSPASVLEICPGCGTGHDKPSVITTSAPRQRRRPLVAVAHAIHRRACKRHGQPAIGCAHSDCPWPGLYRHQHEIPSEDGTWRLLFCSRRHYRAWAVANGIAYLRDRGNAG